MRSHSKSYVTILGRASASSSDFIGSSQYTEATPLPTECQAKCNVCPPKVTMQLLTQKVGRQGFVSVSADRFPDGYEE